MFTGIIEEIGIIKSINHNSLGIDFVISADKIFSDLKLGDSVAVNGCCQTVTNISNKTFTVQAVKETVDLTNFSDLKINDEVNLERALTLQTRLGGHLVAGHVDGVGNIVSIQNSGNSTIFEISANENIIKYMIYKGSITINGVSLTICELSEKSFKVSIIPHTIENTTFKNLKVGDKVNLEPDMVAKYIEKFMTKEDKQESKITLEFLKENGF
ncbi:MAG: riboflavin synthase [Candidatus Gastranaerophilales bacterium]|nr:riboflavin synthase [Candidatus Gastranaerophilales bacterium]